MRWKAVQFGQLYAEPSRNGVYKSKEHHGTGVKIVNMGELFAYDTISGQDMQRLRMSDAEMGKSGLADGDLLFGRRSLVESGAGKCSIVERLTEPTTFESSIIRVRVDPSLIRPRFLFYWFKSPQGAGRVRAIVTGTNVKGIRASVLQTIEVACPTLDIQDAIVSTLRAYDDLIENNRRRIQLLEQAARLLYQEWFAHLRFPGHEHVTITDGVPEGWERRTLGDCADFLSGGTPSKSNPDFWKGNVPWVSSGELTAMRIHRTTLNITPDAVTAGSRLVAPNTILAVVRGMSLAKEFRVGISARPVAFNQDIKALVGKPGIDSLHLFHAIDAQRNSVRDCAGDASHGTKKLPTPVLAGVRILVPMRALQSMFRQTVEPLHSQWDALYSQNQRLEAARDLLLPRLMNGEIPV